MKISFTFLTSRFGIASREENCFLVGDEDVATKTLFLKKTKRLFPIKKKTNFCLFFYQT